MLKDRIVTLTTPEEVDSFLAQHPTSAIFKAGSCHKTMQGFGYVQDVLEQRDDLMCGIIRVLEARPASNTVTEITGIRHESPQLILFVDGEAVFDVDNWGITPEALAPGFSRVPVGEAIAEPTESAQSDLTPYMNVLEQFLTGQIDEMQFEQTYTYMFRDDASLRTKDEVDALNSIFGDIDQHLNMHLMMAQKFDRSVLRERAASAYERLKELQA